ncbi:MAG TPA: hypothetical protein VF941_09630 [Clostridia bacterium]
MKILVVSNEEISYIWDLENFIIPYFAKLTSKNTIINILKSEGSLNMGSTGKNTNNYIFIFGRSKGRS